MAAASPGLYLLAGRPGFLLAGWWPGGSPRCARTAGAASSVTRRNRQCLPGAGAWGGHGKGEGNDQVTDPAGSTQASPADAGCCRPPPLPWRYWRRAARPAQAPRAPAAPLRRRSSTLKTAKIGGVTVLTNAKGFTLYSFAPDTSTKSACNGACATDWPPVKGRRPRPGSRARSPRSSDPTARPSSPSTGTRCTPTSATPPPGRPRATA